MRKIIFHLNCLQQGGVERVVSELANQFAAWGHDVIVSTQWQQEPEFTLHPAARRIHVGLRGDDDQKNRPTIAIRRVKYLRALIRAEKPDVVLAFDRSANYRALVAALGTAAPVVISVRNPPPTYYGSWLNRILVALLFPRAAGCVFQTTEQRDYFSAAIQKKSRVIANPISQKYIDAQAPSARKKEIVNSSRLEDYKNQAGLVRAFIRLHADYPDYVLKIYGGDHGDGTKEELEEIITAGDAAAYVHLMGASDRLEEELNAAAIYVLNSNREGMPNALMEAMALGIPVISTDCPCGGPASLIDDGINGLLVPVGDEAALDTALRRLLDDPDYAESLGRKARGISQRYRADVIAKEWLEYIETLSN